MDKELRFHLQQGGTSVKELARLTGKSTSTIYKALQGAEGVQSKDGDNGKLFFMEPDPQEAVLNGAGDAAPAVSTQPSAEPAAVASAPSTARRGRKATAAGQRLTHIGPLDAANVPFNPRRLHSHGWRSLNIIIDNPGITTEEFIAQGGRTNDLRWDIAHGNVKAE